MNCIRHVRHVLICALSLVALTAHAQTNTPTTASAPASQPAASITVAILDFIATSPGSPELGQQIAETVTAMLSGEAGFSLVDRSSITKTLQEQQLNLSGVVDVDQAIKIGRLVGAKILVSGKAFPLGKQLLLTSKIIGTETSLVEGVFIKGKEGDDIAELTLQLAEKTAEKIREAGPRLVASDGPADPLPALKQKLKGRKLPTLAVMIVEQHFAQAQPRNVIDPAVETEVKLLLRECGIQIADIAQNDLADWAKLASPLDVNAWPRGLKDVDLIVTGKAFSEFTGRIGELVNCSARAEINVISRQDGKIVVADRQTSRAVDLSENIAGKKALEKAGHAIGIRILEHLAKTTPEVEQK